MTNDQQTAPDDQVEAEPAATGSMKGAWLAAVVIVAVVVLSAVLVFVVITP